MLFIVFAGTLIFCIHEKSDDADILGYGQGAPHCLNHHDPAEAFALSVD
ncbi:MAG: hypothetical protein P1P74_09915 [Desulfuromonadales bacterium]|nr:hypothetical protein [Desulfuromonadales bacterium]